MKCCTHTTNRIPTPLTLPNHIPHTYRRRPAPAPLPALLLPQSLTLIVTMQTSFHQHTSELQHVRPKLSACSRERV